MSVIIGIPVHNDLESFKAMMKSLINSTDFYDKIIIIESESIDGGAELCDELAKATNIEVIHTKKEGPIKAYNCLFEIAKKEKADLLLTQTDVVFPKLYKRDWLKILHDTANLPECSAATCINGGGVSGPDYIDGFRWLGGWCTYIPFKTIEKVGGFDETFPEGEYGVDIDLSYKISKLGRIYICNYWVDHHMMNSREHDKHPDAEKHKQECARYFRKKWKLGEFKDGNN